jgi:uracil-DNA glycosylase family 4
MKPVDPAATEFGCLVREAKSCLMCERMNGSQRVIGHASGRIDAPIMFIGEAPGRLGADASAIPFHGDKAGDNFESLLEQVGLSRYDCFITNAILCNPKDENGNNSTPSRTELSNCAPFLKRQLDLVDPKIVVTLGAQALAATKLIEPHDLQLATSVRKKWNWYDRLLVPLYHPGQRAMLHRSFLNQLADYRFVAETYRKLASVRRVDTRQTSNVVSQIAQRLLSVCGPLSYFALHKLFYLTEYEHCRATGQRMTNCYIIRQKDGPYVVELNIKKLKKALPELRVWNEGQKLMLSVRSGPTLFDRGCRLSGSNPDSIERVGAKYGARSDDELKRVVYLTAPMRQILRREKYRRENLFNVPIDFTAVRTTVPRTDSPPNS